MFGKFCTALPLASAAPAGLGPVAQVKGATGAGNVGEAQILNLAFLSPFHLRSIEILISFRLVKL